LAVFRLIVRFKNFTTSQQNPQACYWQKGLGRLRASSDTAAVDCVKFKAGDLCPQKGLLRHTCDFRLDFLVFNGKHPKHFLAAELLEGQCPVARFFFLIIVNVIGINWSRIPDLLITVALPYFMQFKPFRKCHASWYPMNDASFHGQLSRMRLPQAPTQALYTPLQVWRRCLAGVLRVGFKRMMCIYHIYSHIIQCEALKIAKLVYNSNNHGLWYL